MVTEWRKVKTRQKEDSIRVIAFPAHVAAFPFHCTEVRLSQNSLHLRGFFGSFLLGCKVFI
jgi:hypothetical protein